MSRFYDVLKEASRLRSPNGNGDGALREVLPADLTADFPENGDARPQAATEPEPVAVLQAEAPFRQAEPAHTPVPPVDAALWPENPPRHGTSVSVHASVDRRARLLPFISDSVVLEHYRRLRTKLLQEHEARPYRLLMVGSANPQEGKTVTSVNLALSFAMLPSCRVLLVDGDLRKGSLGKWLGVNGPPGLSDLIEGTAALKEVILKSEDLPIHFILSGNSKTSPAELLNSPHLKDNFRQMAEQFDVVIVDSPPLNLVTDAQLLAGCCDAILLVARAFSTTRKGFEKMVQDLQPFRIIGTILNGGTRVPNYRRYNSYY